MLNNELIESVKQLPNAERKVNVLAAIIIVSALWGALVLVVASWGNDLRKENKDLKNQAIETGKAYQHTIDECNTNRYNDLKHTYEHVQSTNNKLP